MSGEACVCGHPATSHGDEETDDACDECECPWYCTEAEADEVIGAAYEHALADGEPWAVESHDRHRSA